MLNQLVFLIAFFCTTTFFSQSSEFIIISNVGSSNSNIASLIISYEKIDSLTYNRKVFDNHLKYKSYRNIIVSKNKYNKLFNYLNNYENPIKRDEKFIKESQLQLIVDYRKDSNSDYIFLSSKDYSTALFSIRNINCYLKRHKYPQELINAIILFEEYYRKIIKESNIP